MTCTSPICLALLALVACAGAPADSPDDFRYDGTGIEFNVAPLTLDALADACYSFAIYNEQGDLVVGRGPGAAAGVGGGTLSGTELQTVCASQFGNGSGGDVSCIAPCDAQAPPAGVGDGDAVNIHTVRLWVDALCTSAGADNSGVADWEPVSGTPICAQLQNYVNPCGVGGCDLQVACAENPDTPVSFNFTVMGQADQGFFDVAVNFDDVFCSAKLDDCYTDASPILLVHDPVSGQRIRTGVAAVACTRGSDEGAVDLTTYLLMSTLTVTCANGPAGPASPPIAGVLDFRAVSAEGNLAIGHFPGGE